MEMQAEFFTSTNCLYLVLFKSSILVLLSFNRKSTLQEPSAFTGISAQSKEIYVHLLAMGLPKHFCDI